MTVRFFFLYGALGAAVLAALATVPLFASGYHLALGISMLSYVVLATAWALFSGPTRYVSLATAAFFGVGAYAAAVLAEVVAWPLVLAVAAVIGAALAAVVGLSTLRLSGIYFVIFSFGLAELIRQLVTWYESNINRSVGRYVFTDITQAAIYWQLLGIAALVLVAGYVIGRSRLGIALRVIGEDETVARHVGFDTTAAKLTAFTVSAVFVTVTGAVMAPRWTYVDPVIAFNPLVSFQVVIMALLGGAGRVLGPLLGVIPLVLLFELISANFPNYFSILLGLIFLVIVYLLPNGVAGFVGEHWRLPAVLTDRIRIRGAKCGQDAVAAVDVGAARAATAHVEVPGRVETMTTAPMAPVTAGHASPILVVDALGKSFGGLRAVDSVQFDIPRGATLGLIGPNGSGKTTVLNLISGALRPDSGAIRFNGVELAGLPPHRIARLGVARTFQLVRVLPSMTCAENVTVGIAALAQYPLWGGSAQAATHALLDRVGLTRATDLPAGALTYIDQKRLELARALALAPKLLLLDEWLAGLNPSELKEGIALVRSLREDDITVIMVEHVMDAIRSLCDRCIVMNVGRKIADGSPAEVLVDREVVHAYLGDADA